MLNKSINLQRNRTMNDLISKLYRHSGEEFEESQLRSVLLFSEFGKTHQRTDMLPKAVLSIIIHDKGKSTIDSIVKKFGPCYKYETSQFEISEAIRKLEEQNFIECKDGKYIAITETDEKKTTEFFAKLEERTEHLINSIITRYETDRKCTVQNRTLFRSNITKALSLYLKLSGLNAVMKDPDEQYQPVSNAVSLILEKTDHVSGMQLINAIGQVLANPSKEDGETLNIWARAYVLTQVMNIDPTLVNFKATKLRDKTFVLDTDVVLNLLATHARYSQQYRTILGTLADLGCKIIIPEEVIKDVDGHVGQAWSIYNKYGKEQIDNLTEALLEGTESNVFIEDYVKSRREEPSKKKMDFSIYINNIYKSTDLSIFKRRLKPILKENVDLKIDVVDLSEDKYDLWVKLTEEASGTPRGGKRSYDTNKALSLDDARLFMTMNLKNKDLENKLDRGMLRYKYYFLTQSKRTIKVAQELGIYEYDIICNPIALGSVLSEIGYVDKDKISIINLFENPFLASSAVVLWEKIKPILDRGEQIPFMEIQQLESNVGQLFDNILISDDPKERIEMSRTYKAQGNTFLGQLADVVDERDEVMRKLAESESENERLKQENAKKEQHIQYLNKVSKLPKKKSTKLNLKAMLKQKI